MSTVSADFVADAPPPDCDYTLPPYTIHLEAKRYSMGGKAWQVYTCKVVGQPGTLITNGSVNGLKGSLFGGTLHFEDVDIGLQFSTMNGAIVSITRGNIRTSQGLYIVDSRASFINSSVDVNNIPLNITRSNVSLVDSYFGISYAEAFIDDSIVSLHNSLISQTHHCPQIVNTTFTLVDSKAACSNAFEPWVIRDSELKLRQSSSLTMGVDGAYSHSLQITGSVVNATCAAGATIDVGDATIANSAVYFGNCSCQMSHGIAVAGSLSITGGSIAYGKCEHRPSEALPISMLV